jgi:hypothetical protein
MTIKRDTVHTVTYVCNRCKKEETTQFKHGDEPKPAEWLALETTVYGPYGATFKNWYHFCPRCKNDITAALRVVT